MRGDQLLLLAERVDEAKRVRAKANDRHDREQHKRPGGAPRNSQPLPQSGWREHHKRQHQTRGCLHAHAHNE